MPKLSLRDKHLKTLDNLRFATRANLGQYRGRLKMFRLKWCATKDGRERVRRVLDGFEDEIAALTYAINVIRRQK